eukprot:1890849-Rhodomonas_salina.2
MHPAQQPAPDAQLQGTVQPPTRNTAVAAQAEKSASSHGRDGSTRAEQPEQATAEEDEEVALPHRPMHPLRRARLGLRRSCCTTASRRRSVSVDSCCHCGGHADVNGVLTSMWCPSQKLAERSAALRSGWRPG